MGTEHVFRRNRERTNIDDCQLQNKVVRVCFDFRFRLKSICLRDTHRAEGFPASGLCAIYSGLVRIRLGDDR